MAIALIKDFTYEFSPEDRIGIIGNGTGKSTLMDIITGRVQPDSGSVEIIQFTSAILTNTLRHCLRL